MLGQSKRILGLLLYQVIVKSLTAEFGFKKTPSNTVAVVGQLMKMTCWANSDETAQWFFTRHGNRLFVYNGKTVSNNFTPRFSVTRFPFIHDLTARNVTTADAGIYECVLLSRETQGRSTPVTSNAELIVLESEPVCNSNISNKNGSITEFDNVEFRCAVNFSGQYVPSMQWSEGERNLSETSIIINRNISHGMQHLTSVAMLQVNAEKNGIMINCKTQFGETHAKVLYTNATNIPHYSFRWNTTLNVHFGARNVIITPVKDMYRLEDVLTCTAVGNPSPSYLWRKIRTNETIEVGPYLALSKTRIDADQRYTIECVVQNHVAGEDKLSSAKVDVHVTISGYEQFPFGYIIGAGLGIGCTLVAVFIARCIEKKLTSRKSKDKADLAKENAQSLSPDYDSIRETELNESKSMPTTPETAAPTEDIVDDYSALTERPVINQLAVVYSSIEATPFNVEVLPNMASKMPPLYVNIANY